MGVHRLGQLSDVKSHSLRRTTGYLSGSMHPAIGATRKMDWDGLAGDLL
jgi:hypothetical protein